MSKYKLATTEKPFSKPSRAHEPTDFEEKEQKSYERVYKFLKRIRCEDYFKIFKDNEIFFEDLKLLKEQDILELGLPIGPRNRVLSAIENFEAIAAEEQQEEQEDYTDKLKEILEFAGAIAQKQNELIESIKKCQEDIQKIQYETGHQDYAQNSLTNGYQREYLSSISPKVDRVLKPTLSSIAKQKVIPNKYMQVSPLRVSYYNKFMS